jgi:hypothetical protein
MEDILYVPLHEGFKKYPSRKHTVLFFLYNTVEHAKKESFPHKLGLAALRSPVFLGSHKTARYMTPA